MVLNRPGDDLRRRCASAVHHDHQRDIDFLMFARSDVILCRIGRATLGVNDHLTLVEEVIGHADRCVEKSARIAAEVEHQPLHALLFQLFNRIVELAHSGGREVFDLDVSDAGPEHQHVGNGVRGDGCAHNRQRNRFLDAHANDLDVDGCTLRSLQTLDYFVEREVVGRSAFNFGDDVAGADTQARGGSAFQRGDDGDLIVALGDQDAQTVEGALLPVLHVRVLFRLEERGVRIERPQHSVDRGVDELVRGGVFRSPGCDRSEQIRVLFQALLHVALHRRAKQAVAVESAKKRRPGDSDQKRERKGPLVRLLDSCHLYLRSQRI